MQFTALTFLICVALGKLINPNPKHSTLRPPFGTLYTFQGLSHWSFDRYDITSKLILTREKDIHTKEMGHVYKFITFQMFKC